MILMAVPTSPSRRIDLERSFNFRDLGGYRGVGGRTVRWRTLFRADGLHRLSPADLATLADLGLHTVVDLRTAGELEARGRIEWPSGELAFHHLPLMDVLPPATDYQQWSEPAHVADQYARMLTDGAAAIGSAVDLLCRPASYPLVYHCTAGKDRTGIISALVLRLLGVPDADIVADYALSAGAMVRMLAWLRRTQPVAAAEIEASAAAIVAAEPETMARFLDGLDERHGGAEAYVAALGRPDAADTLRGLLLQPAA